MKTEPVKLSQIQVNEANPRIIKNDKFTKLVNSLLDFPKMLEIRPIVVDNTLTVLGGNMRLRALTAIAGMTEDELKARLSDIRDFKKKTDAEQEALIAYWERWQDNPTVPVTRASDLSDAEQKAFIIKDNLGYGEWDYDMLANDWDMEELTEWGLDVDFGVGDEKGEEKDAEEDGYDVDAENIPERCSAGDLWELGTHRLLCGDSTRQGDIERLMGGEKADLVVTDPPYNVNYEGKSKSLAKADRRTHTDGRIANDNMGESAFVEFLTRAFGTMKDAMRPGAAFYVWHASMRTKETLESLGAAGLQYRQILIWVKSTFTLGRQDYQWMHEPCAYGWKEGRTHYFVDDRTLATVFEDKGVDYRKMRKGELLEVIEKLTGPKVPTTVIREEKPVASVLHPTMKPVRLMERLIRNSSRQGEIILDPFGGSGSTLVAAEQLGRRCFMMELTPHYCDVIIDRWEKLTGRSAELVSSSVGGD